MNFEETAKSIIAAVGGEENISSVGNCMTRLRFVLKDQSKVDAEAVHKIKAVKGVSKSGGQYQLIVGSENAEDLCSAVNSLGSFTQMSPDIKKKVNVGDVILDTLSGSMVPLIGLLVGVAMINVVVSIAGLCGANTSVGTWAFLAAVAGAGTYFLPVFVGYTCAKKIGTSPVFGMFMGMVLIYPTLSSLISAEGGLKLFGITLVKYGYSGTIIPTILSVILLKYVEKLVRKIVPKIVSVFMVPALIFLICVPITYLVLGPLGNFISGLISTAVIFLMNHAGFLAIGIFAALLPFLVLSGMHVAAVTIYLACISAFGYDPIFFPAFMAYNIATGGIALAVALRAKDSDTKQLGFSCTVSSICGITEPSLFGICLPRKRLFFILMASSGIAGMISYFVNYRVTVPIAQSVFSIPAAAGAGEGNILAAVIVFASAFVISFVAAFLFGEKRPSAQNDKKKMNA